MRSFLIIIALIYSIFVFGQFPVDSIMRSNRTPTYSDLIDFYEKKALEYEDIQLFNMGMSDYGLPIYLCVLNSKENDSSEVFRSMREGTTMLINNAIHPGEPCGVNASMQFVIDHTERSEKEKKKEPFVGIIPAYNIGGMMNRGAYSRANQVGPKQHGFRGNASNLDLNRDFVKMDSKNMHTFATIFQAMDPDLFIDTHTSNGADYQYTLTYIDPIHAKLAPSLREVYEGSMIPFLKDYVQENSSYELFPYVNLKGKVLTDGMVQYNATPRYSMGYADLFHTFSFTTETHMLKPFIDRVKSTHAFLHGAFEFVKTSAEEIETARKKAVLHDLEQSKMEINFTVDTVGDNIFFKGYHWQYEESTITSGKRLKYDRSKPKEMQIPYYNRFAPTESVRIPKYYVVERQADEVIERLIVNKVDFTTIENDTIVELSSFKLESYQTVKTPYEGHYLHYDIEYSIHNDSIRLKRGDVIIPTDQVKRRFVVKMLSPNFVDSYFAWNFFDSYLQQKEHFSPYVFEDIAVQLLEDNQELNKRFKEKMKAEPKFSENRYQQLLFIYRNSPHYEDHGVLPIYMSFDE